MTIGDFWGVQNVMPEIDDNLGCSIVYMNNRNKYINNLKLARAEELILTELYTIDKVAELSGFDDASYFCRYFKKTTGVTPSEYRRSQS